MLPGLLAPWAFVLEALLHVCCLHSAVAAMARCWSVLYTSTALSCGRFGVVLVRAVQIDRTQLWPLRRGVGPCCPL